MDFSLNEKISDVVLPYSNNSKNIIRLTFGKNEPINLINNNYFIKQLDKEEVINYLVNNVSNYDCNEHWSDLLNLCLSSENNILGLKISGKEIPPLEIINQGIKNSFSAKTLIIFVEKN